MLRNQARAQHSGAKGVIHPSVGNARLPKQKVPSTVQYVEPRLELNPSAHVVQGGRPSSLYEFRGHLSGRARARICMRQNQTDWVSRQISVRATTLSPTRRWRQNHKHSSLSSFLLSDSREHSLGKGNLYDPRDEMERGTIVFLTE